jgi:exodeoxyribonuclease VII large subunit
LRRRHESVGILIYPAQVQGADAPSEVAAGVRYFNRAKNVDVIIVARGGGSLEDLAAFNDEGLARVIAGSTVPVISAVGHETDFTIADFIADLRAPTPSAAAELVIESKHQIEERVESLRSRLARSARYRVLMARQALTELAQHGAFARMQDALVRREQRLDELVFRLAAGQQAALRLYRRRLDVASARMRHHDFRRGLAAMRRDLEGRTGQMRSAMEMMMMQRRSRLEQWRARVEEMSPLKILERGYAVVFDDSGALVKDAAQVNKGDSIRARVARGEIKARVE